MGLKIIAIGELSGWSKLAFEDYRKRLAAPFTLQHIQIPTPKRSKSANALQMMSLEAKKIIKHLDGEFVVTLDQHGKAFTSEQFTTQLNKWHQSQSVCFILGGPDGIHDDIKILAKASLSLSNMVLPHALARVMLIEQIYRAYTIAQGHPYHRA